MGEIPGRSLMLLTKDDGLQLRKALALFESNDVFIADTVLLESEWVLRYAYGFFTVDINQAQKK
jgi:predicted nucleic-acid-binding protein